MVSRITLSVFAIIACGLFFCSAHFCVADIKSEGSSIKIETGTMTINLDRKTGQPSIGGLKITEGVEAKPLTFSEPYSWKINAGNVSYSMDEKSGGISLKTAFRASGILHIDLTFDNKTAQQRLLEVGYSVLEPGNELTWWDGRMKSDPGTNQMSYERTLLRLPMSTVYSGTHGSAVGLDPHFLSSMFASGADRVDGGLLVNFRIRIVLDPGQKLILPLYAFNYNARYGYLDAVQKLYDSYPDMFNMAPGMRPIVVSSGGYLMSGKTARHLQCEETRRLGMGWEWAYKVWQRYGNAYPDEQYYDPELGYAGNIDAHGPVVKGSLEDFRRDMRERFHAGWSTAALAYFTMQQAADEEIIKQYPDALIVDGKGVAVPPWFTTLDYTTLSKKVFTARMAYPWGNSYGRKFMQEIDNIALDFQPSMIAFDEANRIDCQYAPSVKGETARAWDTTGVFSSVQVALGRLADYVHTHKVRGYTLGQAMNKPWTYNTATRSDVAMHEWVPWENIDSAIGLRLLMGNKAMSWWQELNMTGLIKWESLTPEQIREAAAGIEDYVRLLSFKYAAIPANFQEKGTKGLIDMMPMLTELCKEGWQAVPAVKGNEDLWLSRYGKGVHTFISVGNPKKEQRKADLQIDTEYLGKGHFLFSDYTGNPFETLSSNGKAKIDMGMMASHDQRIARALVQIVPSSEIELTGSAACSWEPMTEGKIEAKWVSNRTGSRLASVKIDTLIIRVPSGASVNQLKLNGKICKYTVSGKGAVMYSGKLPDKCNMSLTYRPSVSIMTKTADLIAFPFVADTVANSSIRLPKNANDTDKLSAQRISSYFEWYYRRQAAPNIVLWDLPKNGTSVALPIKENSESTLTTYEVVLVKSTNPASISLSKDAKRLTISGRNPAERDLAVLRLLSLLDKKYPFYITLPDSPMFKKAELSGKTLP